MRSVAPMPAGLSCHTGTRTAAARRSHPAAGPSAPTPCGCWERLPSAEGRGGAESVAETGSEVLVKGGRVRRLRACGVGRRRSLRAQTWRRSGERQAECGASRPRSPVPGASSGARASSPPRQALGPLQDTLWALSYLPTEGGRVRSPAQRGQASGVRPPGSGFRTPRLAWAGPPRPSVP